MPRTAHLHLPPVRVTSRADRGRCCLRGCNHSLRLPSLRGHDFVCLHEGCDYTSRRSTDLQRPSATMHTPRSTVTHAHRRTYDCPLFPHNGCRRNGGYLFTRLDHLYEHLRVVHRIDRQGIQIPPKPPGDVVLYWDGRRLHWIVRPRSKRIRTLWLYRQIR